MATAGDDLERRCLLDGEIRAVGDGATRRLTGYVVKYGSVANLGPFTETVRRGAFRRALQRGSDVVALWNHQSSHPLGRTPDTLTLRDDDIGLFAEILLPQTQAGRDAWESVARRDVRGFSFGFRLASPNGELWEYLDDGSRRRVLVDLELIEVSPTPLPAYKDSSIAARSRELMAQGDVGLYAARLRMLHLAARAAGIA